MAGVAFNVWWTRQKLSNFDVWDRSDNLTAAIPSVSGYATVDFAQLTEIDILSEVLPHRANVSVVLIGFLQPVDRNIFKTAGNRAVRPSNLSAAQWFDRRGKRLPLSPSLLAPGARSPPARSNTRRARLRRSTIALPFSLPVAGWRWERSGLVLPAWEPEETRLRLGPESS